MSGSPGTGQPTSLLTDQYELTMVAAALADGTAARRCTFEVFARRLPEGRRYGVVAGTGRLLDAVEAFRFGEAELERLGGILGSEVLDWLADYRFHGDIDGYPEGELYFPGSPILSVSGTFADAVVLETLSLSILNHDAAVAAAAARMVTAAAGRPLIEMGSRRTHEEAAVAAARATYLAGFAATSNLEAGRRYGVPTAGTAAHAYVLLHDDELTAFRGQVAALGAKTTLLVDTYDIRAGIAHAIEAAGPELGAIRIDSGDLGELARQAREQLDSLGASGTQNRALRRPRRVRHRRATRRTGRHLRGRHVGGHRLGRADGRVRLQARRGRRPAGSQAQHVQGVPRRREVRGAALPADGHRRRGGRAPPDVGRWSWGRTTGSCRSRWSAAVTGSTACHDLEQSREHLRAALVSVPWEGLKLSRGEPAVPSTFPDA